MKKHFDIYVPKICAYLAGEWMELTPHGAIYTTVEMSSTIPIRYLPERVIDLRNQSNKVFEILAKSKR